MPTEKTLSIIIPSYNMETYLPQCLDSLLGPDVPVELLDIIVVNDGSRDRTSEIAHSYADRYPDSIRVIDKANGNYGSCINAALPTARGRYVKILDADDSFSPDSFPAYVRFLTSATADLVLNDYATVDPEGKTIATTKFNGTNGSTMSADEFAQNVLPSAGLAMHSIAYRCGIFQTFEYKQTEGISYTDTEWVVIPMMKVETASCFSGIVYRYLLGRDGQTMAPKTFMKNIESLILVAKRLTVHLTQNQPIYNKAIFHHIMEYMAFRYQMFYQPILDYGTKNHINLLANFDKWVLSQPSIPCVVQLKNVQLKLCPFIKFKYINYWRKKEYSVHTLYHSIRRIFLNIQKRLSL